MSIKRILLRVLCLAATLTHMRRAYLTVRPSVRMFQQQKRWGNIYKIPCENFMKRKSNDFILILHGTLYTKSFHTDLRMHKLSNQFSAHDNFLSRFESIPKLEKSTYIMYHLNSMCEKLSDICLNTSCAPYNSDSSTIERNIN
jgi:hypothetical protein